MEIIDRTGFHDPEFLPDNLVQLTVLILYPYACSTCIVVVFGVKYSKSGSNNFLINIPANKYFLAEVILSTLSL